MACLRVLGVGLAALLLAAGVGHAQVSTISVSGPPGTMRISGATPGLGLIPVTDATTTYSISTTSPDAVKITARISSGGSMPANTNLTLTLAAPGGGGTSAGARQLTTSDQDFVTGITAQVSSGRAITYLFSAAVSAPPFAATSRTITFTITAQ